MYDDRGSAGEDGFSLIELMVVVLIIGILIAIALPTFLGARTRAQDRALQTNLRTGLVAGLVFYSDNGNFTGFDVPTASGLEPSLQWVGAGGPATSDEISIQVGGGTDLLLVGMSKSGTYFCIAQVAGSPATSRGKGAAFAGVDTLAECTGGW